MPTDSTHDITTRLKGKLALSVCDKSAKRDIQGVARLLDLDGKRQLGEFPVRHECPGMGSRIALSPDDKFCFVGCYNVYGIASYSLPDGKEIWRRNDLKSVQSVRTLEFQNLVFCGRETGAAHLLEAKSGETAEKLRGVKEIFGSLFDETVMVCGRSLELHRPFGKKLWSEKTTNEFGCGIYFTQTEFVILERGLIRCFDICSQELIWSHRPVETFRFSENFFLNEGVACFQMFQIQDEGPFLVSLNRKTGQVIGKSRLLPGAGGSLCLGGKALLTENLCLFSSKSGALLHDFTTEAILAQDPRHRNKLIQSLAGNSMSPVDLEEYMTTEGFSAQEITKAVFIKISNEERSKRRT